MFVTIIALHSILILSFLMSLLHLHVSIVVSMQAHMSCNKSLMVTRLLHLLSFIAFINNKFNYKYTKYYAVKTLRIFIKTVLNFYYFKS